MHFPLTPTTNGIEYIILKHKNLLQMSEQQTFLKFFFYVLQRNKHALAVKVVIFVLGDALTNRLAQLKNRAPQVLVVLANRHL